MREHGEEAVRVVIDWALSSPDSMAKFLREKQLLDGGTLWEPEKFRRYLSLARQGQTPQKQTTPTTANQNQQKPMFDREAMRRALRKGL